MWINHVSTQNVVRHLKTPLGCLLHEKTMVKRVSCPSIHVKTLITANVWGPAPSRASSCWCTRSDTRDSFSNPGCPWDSLHVPCWVGQYHGQDPSSSHGFSLLQLWWPHFGKLIWTQNFMDNHYWDYSIFISNHCQVDASGSHSSLKEDHTRMQLKDPCGFGDTRQLMTDRPGTCLRAQAEFDFSLSES